MAYPLQLLHEWVGHVEGISHWRNGGLLRLAPLGGEGQELEEASRVLEALTLSQVPPFADPTEMQLAQRLNLLTGDNGAGKTFLLDLAWTSLTRTWNSWKSWFDGKGKDEPSLLVEGHRTEVDTRYKQKLTY